MTIYIVDTTLRPPVEKRFPSYPQAVQYLESMSLRAFGQTRKQRMVLLEECGHGYDDTNSVTFVRSMADMFEMGVIRDDAGVSRRMKCDITNLQLWQRDEFGN